jgi:hypothetical protein
MRKPRFKRFHLILIGMQRCREVVQFYLRNFSAPYPTFIKRKTLVSNATSNATWIETGTYMGSTSKFLAKRYPKVVTIEPSDFFYQFAKSRLNSCRNVEILFGQSEIHFESVLIQETEHVNIWLDGHFSEGGTFQGENVSPIVHELESIARHKSRFKSISVFVDDVRLFKRTESHVTEYPPFAFLLEWAQRNGFNWEIQNDIYIAKYMDKIIH